MHVAQSPSPEAEVTIHTSVLPDLIPVLMVLSTIWKRALVDSILGICENPRLESVPE
jgi:hypothetical protein